MRFTGCPGSFIRASATLAPSIGFRHCMMKHERKDVPKKKRKAWTETQHYSLQKSIMRASKPFQKMVQSGVRVRPSSALTKQVTCDDIGY